MREPKRLKKAKPQPTPLGRRRIRRNPKRKKRLKQEDEGRKLLLSLRFDSIRLLSSSPLHCDKAHHHFIIYNLLGHSSI
jgi:hypothetical protein